VVSWDTLRAYEISGEGQTMQTSPKRLETLMSARRLELGMRTWKALADRAGVSYETVRALKAGGIIREDSVYAIERALCWRPGSIRRILTGGEPIPSVATAHADLGGLGATAHGTVDRAAWRQQKIAEARAAIREALDDGPAPSDVDEFALEERIARIRRRLARDRDTRSAAELDLWLRLYEDRDAG
jgi:hypothetical protein